MEKEHHSPPTKVAIDGPVACGKSAVGMLVAHRLGYRFLDTGMMYRAFTWLVLERGVDPENEAAVAELAKSVKVEVTASLPNSEESGRVLVDGEDATAYPCSARRRGGRVACIETSGGERGDGQATAGDGGGRRDRRRRA